MMLLWDTGWRPFLNDILNPESTQWHPHQGQEGLVATSLVLKHHDFVGFLLLNIPHSRSPTPCTSFPVQLNTVKFSQIVQETPWLISHASSEKSGNWESWEKLPVIKPSRSLPTNSWRGLEEPASLLRTSPKMMSVKLCHGLSGYIMLISPPFYGATAPRDWVISQGHSFGTDGIES